MYPMVPSTKMTLGFVSLRNESFHSWSHHISVSTRCAGRKILLDLQILYSDKNEKSCLADLTNLFFKSLLIVSLHFPLGFLALFK